MDFVKDALGVEVQFGKYAFMVHNVCSKMTIFKNLVLKIWEPFKRVLKHSQLKH